MPLFPSKTSLWRAGFSTTEITPQLVATLSAPEDQHPLDMTWPVCIGRSSGGDRHESTTPPHSHVHGRQLSAGVVSFAPGLRPH